MKQNRDRLFFRRELFRDRQNNLNSLFSASYDKQVLENGIKVILTVGKSSLLSQKELSRFFSEFSCKFLISFSRDWILVWSLSFSRYS